MCQETIGFSDYLSNKGYGGIIYVCGFLMVAYEQRLKNVYGDFLILEFQTGEWPAVCTRVSGKLGLSLIECGKDRNDDALHRWRMAYWVRYNTVLTLASQELSADLVLREQQCGEACTTSIPVLFTSKCPKAAAKLSLCIGRMLSLSGAQPGALHEYCVHR
jgi:hypothetical protein